MVTRNEWYERVNETWKAFGKPIPKPTDAEAIAGARKLYRFAIGKTWTGSVRITSGNRYSWIQNGVLVVNPNQWDGERGIVHLLSHYCHRKVNPGVRPHGGAHARLEIRLIKEVIKRGWLAGSIAPKQENPALDTKVLKFQRLQERIARWEAKQKRAENALTKLHKRVRYYENKLTA